MFLIECPWCGKRDQSEFKCGGEADRPRPLNPEELSDAEWADYVFMRRNTKGAHRSLWVHSHGCGQWFVITHDTAKDLILRTEPVASHQGRGAAALEGEQEGKHK